jgi:hypothetical protein
MTHSNRDPAELIDWNAAANAGFYNGVWHSFQRAREVVASLHLPGLEG